MNLKTTINGAFIKLLKGTIFEADIYNYDVKKMEHKKFILENDCEGAIGVSEAHEIGKVIATEVEWVE